MNYLLVLGDQDLLVAKVRVDALQEGALIGPSPSSRNMRWVIALWVAGLGLLVAFFIAIVVWHYLETWDENQDERESNQMIIVIPPSIRAKFILHEIDE